MLDILLRSVLVTSIAHLSVIGRGIPSLCFSLRFLLFPCEEFLEFFLTLFKGLRVEGVVMHRLLSPQSQIVLCDFRLHTLKLIELFIDKHKKA